MLSNIKSSVTSYTSHSFIKTEALCLKTFCNSMSVVVTTQVSMSIQMYKTVRKVSLCDSILDERG